MPRYVAFLRGVMPMNANMSDLRRCVEAAGMSDVTTVLASGNVVFSARKASEASLERAIEAAMATHLGRTFHTIVRPSHMLSELLEQDPFGAFALPSNAKRIVTFLREPITARPTLPHVSDGVHILAAHDREVFSAYEPNPKGPVFMTMLEKMFGTNVTTRTWDTVRKCAVR